MWEKRVNSPTFYFFPLSELVWLWRLGTSRHWRREIQNRMSSSINRREHLSWQPTWFPDGNFQDVLSGRSLFFCTLVLFTPVVVVNFPPVEKCTAFVNRYYTQEKKNIRWTKCFQLINRNGPEANRSLPRPIAHPFITCSSTTVTITYNTSRCIFESIIKMPALLKCRFLSEKPQHHRRNTQQLPSDSTEIHVKRSPREIVNGNRRALCLGWMLSWLQEWDACRANRSPWCWALIRNLPVVLLIVHLCSPRLTLVFCVFLETLSESIVSSLVLSHPPSPQTPLWKLAQYV